MSEPVVTQDNADQAAYWNARAGATWTELQERIDAVFTHITAAALGAAMAQPGERVLDVGCGCGATTVALAGQTGVAGSVLGVDISEPMAARARQRLAAAGLDHAEVLVCDAASHGFAPETVDLLFSRFGVMFFADPVAAFANMRRAMRPGGRLLFACWRPLVENSWFTVPLDAARALLPEQPPSDPLAPGPFAFADAARVTAVLEAAGWTAVSVARADVPMPIAGPGQVDQATDFATRVGALARQLVEVDPETAARAKAAVGEALRKHDRAEGVVLGGSIWLVSAKAG